MTTLIHQRVDLARSGKSPYVIARMASGWAVIGDVQFLPGYCLLLPDPVVPTLNDLKGEQRSTFLRDMGILGDAVLAVTKARRINYEMLGNTEPALHAHVFPRFDNEDEALRKRPVWFYDWSAGPAFDPEKHADIMKRIATELMKRDGIVSV
ncbi:MAG: HIT family protein [Oligoflexales bacterium]